MNTLPFFSKIHAKRRELYLQLKNHLAIDYRKQVLAPQISSLTPLQVVMVPTVIPQRQINTPVRLILSRIWQAWDIEDRGKGFMCIRSRVADVLHDSLSVVYIYCHNGIMSVQLRTVIMGRFYASHVIGVKSSHYVIYYYIPHQGRGYIEDPSNNVSEIKLT